MKALASTLMGSLICVIAALGQIPPPKTPITPEMMEKAKFFITTGSLKGVDMAVMDYKYAAKNCQHVLDEAATDHVEVAGLDLAALLGTSPAEAWLVKLRGAYSTLVTYKWRLGAEKSAPTCLYLGQMLLQPAIEAQIRGHDEPTSEEISAMTPEELRKAITFEGRFLQEVESLEVLAQSPLLWSTRVRMAALPP